MTTTRKAQKHTPHRMDETREAFAVLRGIDDRARAIFWTREDATAYAEHLNQTVPFAVAFGSGGHLWVALPWTMPANSFDVDEV